MNKSKLYLRYIKKHYQISRIAPILAPMCFSMTGSFVIGTALAATGVACVRRTAKCDRRFILFALMPLFFGLQQITEGFVWIGLLHHPTWLTNIFAHGFVFFAYCFWPAYIPVAVYLVEKRENRMTKRLLLAAVVFGLGAGLTAFFLIMPGFVHLTTKIIVHSISYDTAVFESLKDLFTIVYLLAVILPFMVIRDIRLKLFGLLLTLSAVFSKVVFDYAFTSVWCFFAALLSLYIVYVVYRLEENSIP